MAVTRTWSWIVLAGAGALLLAACSPSEPETEQPAAPAQQAPAPGQPPVAAGQPPQVAPQAAAPGAPAQAIIEELYVDSEAEPDEGEPPLTVKFVTTVEDQTGEVECEWDYGDGSPKEKALSPTHVYKTEDDFIATVVCKDAKGITGETEVDITVYKYE
jgi:hypothetical protein